MQLKISSAGVAGVADIRDNFPLLYKLTSHLAIGVALQVSVIKHELLIVAELIDCCPAALTLEKFYDLAVGSSHDRGSSRGRDIDGVVDASFGTRISERIQQLVWSYTNHWNDQVQRADETTSENCVFRSAPIVFQWWCLLGIQRNWSLSRRWNCWAYGLNGRKRR